LEFKMTALIRIIGTVAFVFVVYLALRAVADVLFLDPSDNRRSRRSRRWRLRFFNGASGPADVKSEQKTGDHSVRS
jgi:hypothetical protein